MTEPILGIDLGTSNSVVAACDEAGVPHVLAGKGGAKVQPSVVSFHPNGSVVVGAEAKQRKVIDPKNTVYSVKRLIGRTFGAREVQTTRGRAPFLIKEGPNQQPLIKTRGGEFAVPEISAIVLDHMRGIARAALGGDATRAVVTVPANFTDAQRSATATAGAIAGLTVVRVLNEPTAAALAYGNLRALKKTIAVYDFGGGTFDITVLKLDDQRFEVLGTAGDSFLGGDDLDERVVDRLVAAFLAEQRVDLRSNEIAMMRLRAVAEQTKIELSRRTRAIIKIDEIAYGPGGAALDLRHELTRDELVSAVLDVVDQTFPVCDEALRMAGLGKDGIDDIVLVGGTTKMPLVRDRVAAYFGKAPRTEVNPEEAVAVGAALQAYAIRRTLERRTSGRVLAAEPAAPAASANEEPTLAAADAFRSEDSVTEGIPKAPAEPRHTAPMSAAPLKPPMRVTERPAARGAHVDKFDPTKAVPIGRVTKPAAPPPAPADPPPRSPPPPSTPPGVPQPIAVASPPVIPAPVAPARAPSVPPAPARAPSVPPVPARAPSVPPRPVAAPPPTPPRQVAGPDQRTLMMDPAPGGSGLLDFDDAPTGGLTLDDALGPVTSPTLDEFGAPTAEVAPLKPPTARGFGASQPPYASTLSADPRVTNVGVPRSPGARGDLGDGGDDPMPAVSASVLGGWPAAPTAPMPAPTAPLPTVLDVTPRALGVGTVAGFCEELIGRNSRVPLEIKRMFTTSRDEQDAVRLQVCQGESRRLHENVLLGDLVLDRLEPRPRGDTSIEVTFAIDASGILSVRARDARTGREQSCSLDVIGALSPADVSAARSRLQQLRR
ncbi:MAG: Hsp70 family protein [Kofleriaceae bacterium]|nr:Hsp70 family protein [Kofleriaceae bacterium]MBP9202336.1 Hsp70 family protein [Kofleriaceae bacterium]